MRKLFIMILITALFLSASASGQELWNDPVGMWSFYWDARSLNETYKNGKILDFDIQCYNLYIFDDGSAFLTSAEMTDGKADFSYGALSGVWLGDYKSMRIRVGNSTYDAYIDEDDRLFLKLDEALYCIFTRIPSYNYAEGMW